MKLKDGERIVVQENMDPECRAKVLSLLEEIKAVQVDAIRLHGLMNACKARGEYLNKMKWAAFDEFHPLTNSDVHNSPEGYHAHRRYNMEENVVALIDAKDGHDGEGILGAILSAIQRSHEHKEPKEPGNPPGTAAEESAESKQSTATADAA